MSQKDSLVEIRVSQNWARLIKWVATVIPNGTIPIRFVNGQPVKLAGRPEPDIRFDKEMASGTLDFDYRQGNTSEQLD
jgi:hypothetical protein